ncbi:MAG TPA: hypothetical protein VH853_24890 [Polyangia bacterium]|nr:hypothetical protein [Polyangia bacterium]
MRFAVLIPALLAATPAPAAAPRPVVQAVWTASAGPTIYRGDLSAQALSASGNAVVGSWTLLDPAGEVTMHGTWSAKKSGSGWRGTWEAKVQPGGDTFAGTWQAVPPADFHGKTFEDLLLATGGQQISGYWKSKGGAAGAWWLKAAAH